MAVMSLEEFYNGADKETWQGTVTAFRNGAKFRLLKLDAAKSGYTQRRDFREAWKRGYDAMESFLANGDVISDSGVAMNMSGKLSFFAVPAQP